MSSHEIELFFSVILYILIYYLYWPFRRILRVRYILCSDYEGTIGLLREVFDLSFSLLLLSLLILLIIMIISFLYSVRYVFLIVYSCNNGIIVIHFYSTVGSSERLVTIKYDTNRYYGYYAVLGCIIYNIMYLLSYCYGFFFAFLFLNDFYTII